MSAAPSIELGCIMASRLGSIDPSAYPDEEFDLYSIPAFDQGEPEILLGSAIGSAKQIVQPGDVLLSRIVPHIRRAWVVGAERGRRIIASGEWIVFRRDDVDAAYLRHVLVCDTFHSEFMRTVSGVGGSLLRARPAYVAKIKIPLPRLPEQRRIAEILDKADALRAKRRAALAQLDTLTQSIFLDMFGDPRKNEKGWPTSIIESVVADVRGGAGLKPEDFVEEGCPVLHKGAIKPSGRIVIDSKKKTFATWTCATANSRCLANRNYVAVTLRDLVPTGPSIGLAADLRKGPFDKYLLAQGTYAFRTDPTALTPEYFVQLSNMPSFRHVLRQNAVGSTQIHIRTPVYMAIRIPVPPIEIQREFARRVAATEAVDTNQRRTLTMFDSLFASIQERVLRRAL